MFRAHPLSLVLLFMAIFFTQCEKKVPYTITEESTSRILKTLSSDDMRGRQAFSEDAKRAADYISNEFTAARLDYLPGEDSYLQKFDLNVISIENADIEIDGTELSSDKYFGAIYSEQVSWNPGSVGTATISASDNFRAKQRELSSSDTDLIVFVDESHTSTFNAYHRFYSRPVRAISIEGEANVLFVLHSESDDFSAEISTKNEPIEMANVAGVIEGKRAHEIVLFSAHYDHIGIRNAVEGDSIANGANDDASGVTAVIELAKHFQGKPKPQRTIMFVAFTAEEVGGYGSRYFSQQLDPDEIVAMFNIEMIGKPAVSGPNTAWITGYDRSSFGEILTESTPDSVFRFYADPYPSQNLFYRSDNATLARLGVPAHSISTTPIDVDQDYHQVSDEFETIDISHMTNTIKAIARAADEIVGGYETPTRVDPALVD